MPDMNNLPMSGGLILVIAGYIVAAFFILGPIVGKRSVERGEWVPRCERAVIESVQRDTPQLQQSTPTPDCKSIMGVFAGRDGEALCGSIGFMFENPLAGQIETANEQLIERHRNRIARAASQATSSCTCAVNVAGKENSNSWAIYAGSFRLIEPAPIANYETELFSALNSDYCRRDFQ